eukprot:s4761_g2.t1
MCIPSQPFPVPITEQCYVATALLHQSYGPKALRSYGCPSGRGSRCPGLWHSSLTEMRRELWCLVPSEHSEL